MIKLLAYELFELYLFWIYFTDQELESPISSNNVQVFVSGCSNSSSDKCFLEIGTNHTITIKFSM